MDPQASLYLSSLIAPRADLRLSCPEAPCTSLASNGRAAHREGEEGKLRSSLRRIAGRPLDTMRSLLAYCEGLEVQFLARVSRERREFGTIQFHRCR